MGMERDKADEFRSGVAARTCNRNSYLSHISTVLNLIAADIKKGKARSLPFL
jgi:hypothetical protein